MSNSQVGNSQVVWSPELGWHDGERATTSLDDAGRLTITTNDTHARIAVLNAHMFGAVSEPGEPDWSEPDHFDIAEFEALVGQPLATYAAENPHMIVTVLS